VKQAVEPATPAELWVPPDSPEPERSGHAEVLVALTRSDLKARYGRGPWRVLKWLVDPLAAIGVYLVLLSVVLERGGDSLALSVACAVVPFQLMMMAVIGGLGAIDQRRSIVANMSFPRMLIPVASTMTEVLTFGASLVVLAGIMAASGVAPTAAVLWLPAVLVVTVVLAVALSYPASLLGLWLPDLRTLVVSGVRTLFFIAPGIVALQEIEGNAHDLLRINPLTGIFEGFRSILLYGHAPAAWQLLFPLAAAALLLVVFLPIYAREQHHLAKVLE